MSRLAARRRSQHETKTGNERWLISYSDFITLLFGFFVVMYSVSQVNESKYKSLAETLNAAFENQPAQEVEQGVERDVEQVELADLDTLSEKITARLEGFPVEGQVSLGANENWIELTFNSELLFTSGSDEPSEAAKDVFAELVDTLEPYQNEIQVVGHTDNVPIQNARFANNWALSSARAVAIVDFMAFQGMKPDQMSAVAFGEYRPVADNTTEDGRRQNRRVVVRVSDSAATAATLSADAVTPALEPLSSQPDLGADESGVSGSDSSSISGNPGNAEGGVLTPSSTGLQPVRLKGGDLLFTSDPDLPRLRELESEGDQ